jgi:glycosyltransferase
MKISIVTATYNRAQTIAEAVHSLHRQSHDDYEHLIQDGGSTDGTLEILESLAGQKTKIVSAPDKGIYDALNKGIARATGDVIGLMHSDDFFASDRVLEQVAEAFADPEIDGVYGDLQYVSATNTSRVIRHWVAGAYTPKALKRGWMPPHPTLYLRQEVFARWGDYDTSYQIAADYDAMLRWLIRGNIKLAYIPEVLVKMRVGGESNRSLGRILQKSREDYRAIKTNGIGGPSTLFFKNARKIGQLIQKGA